MPITLKTSQGTDFVVDSDMASELSAYKWQQHKCGYIYSNLYMGGGRANPIRKKLWMHRHVVGEVPKGMVVDHINGVKSDNRRENLRICTLSQNAVNSKLSKLNTNGYKGVTKQKYGWIARIGVSNKRVYLGSFKCIHAAARAYNEAALKHYGEYAKLNVIKEDI